MLLVLSFWMRVKPAKDLLHVYIIVQLLDFFTFSFLFPMINNKDKYMLDNTCLRNVTSQPHVTFERRLSVIN